jgi:hypothetical protein
MSKFVPMVSTLGSWLTTLLNGGIAFDTLNGVMSGVTADGSKLRSYAFRQRVR